MTSLVHLNNFSAKRGTAIPFVQLHKDLFVGNQSISALGKCLISYMECRPDGWRFNLVEIAQNFKEKRDAIIRALKELKEIGYITKVQVRDEKGQFQKNETYFVICHTLADRPKDSEIYDCSAVVGKSDFGHGPVVGKSDVGFSDVGKSDCIDKDINTDKDNNINKPPKVPQSCFKFSPGEVSAGGRLPWNNRYEDDFEMFWEAWPGQKKGRKTALTAWLKRRPDINVALKALERLQEERSLTISANVFTPPLPHPTTWINQERWNDEIDLKKVRDEINQANSIRSNKPVDPKVQTLATRMEEVTRRRNQEWKEERERRERGIEDHA